VIAKTPALSDASADNERQHQISSADLPLHCPPNGTALWSQHPRVYLPIAAGETALCPYCGNRFFLPKDA